MYHRLKEIDSYVLRRIDFFPFVIICVVNKSDGKPQDTSAAKP